MFAPAEHDSPLVQPISLTPYAADVIACLSRKRPSLPLLAGRGLVDGRYPIGTRCRLSPLNPPRQTARDRVFPCDIALVHSTHTLKGQPCHTKNYSPSRSGSCTKLPRAMSAGWPTGSKCAKFYGKDPAFGPLTVRIRAKTAISPSSS